MLVKKSSILELFLTQLTMGFINGKCPTIEITSMSFKYDLLNLETLILTVYQK